MSRQFTFELYQEESESFFVKNGELNFAIQNHPYDILQSDKFDQTEKQLKEEEKSTGQNITDHVKEQPASIHKNLPVFQILLDRHQIQDDQNIIEHEHYDMDDIQDQPANNFQDNYQLDPKDSFDFFKEIQKNEKKQINLQFVEVKEKLFYAQQDDKNDSKNVPKGFMKALAKFALGKDQQRKEFIKKFCQNQNIDLDNYLITMNKIRKALKISIQDIRNYLTTDEFAKANRILATFFLRKKFASHIYNSKMEKRNIHLKYINRWREVLRNPAQFYGLK